MKILFLTDTHFTGKNPSSRIDDIQETILKKLLDVKKIIEDEGIHVVLHGGDMFHTPDISNLFTGKIASILKSYNVPIYVVPGNHDVFGYNTNTIGNTKLGLLAKTGVVKILDRLNPVVFNDNGFRIGIEGQEYHGNIDEDMTEDFKIYNSNVDYNILVTHSMLLDHKFHEGIKHTLIQDVITTADLVLAGHYHPGWKERSKDNVWFFNPGGVLRVDASTNIVNSMPKVVVFDIGPNKFEHKYVYLQSAKPGAEVFSTKNLDKKIYNATLESFHNKLKNQKFKGVNILNLIDDYVKLNSQDVEAAEYAKAKISKISSEACDNGFIPGSKNIYIDKAEIYNFQAHSKKVIDFTNGLNVIVGESNAGKTAIIRAIYWVLFDKPSGSDFIKTGAKSVKVRLHLSNGYIIERRRTRSVSGTYTLTYPDGKTEEFKGFSNSIPIEILNAHQMPEVKVNGTGYKVNVATQLETPFLIGNSPTERLSLLGALVDADRADAAKREIGTEKKRASTEKNQLIALRDEKVEELSKYEYLDKMKKDIDILEIAIGKLENDEIKLESMIKAKERYESSIVELDRVSARLNSISIPDPKLLEDLKASLNKQYELETIKDRFEKATANLNLIDDRLKSLPNFKNAQNSINDFKEKIEKLEYMENLNTDYNHLDKELKSDKFKVKVDTSICINLIEELKMKLDKVNDLNLLLKENKTLSGNYGVYEERLSFIKNSIKDLEAKRLEKIDSLKNVHEICEHCGSEINFERMLGA